MSLVSVRNKLFAITKVKILITGHKSTTQSIVQVWYHFICGMVCSSVRAELLVVNCCFVVDDNLDFYHFW